MADAESEKIPAGPDAETTLFVYKEKTYPAYLKQGNACQYVAPFARKFCRGRGLDVGCGKWPLEGSIPVDLNNGDALHLPEGSFDYIFSSHCLEHLTNPIRALEHWKSKLVDGGCLFLYLPHPDMEYWLPQNCRKHLHSWYPHQMAKILEDLGFVDVIYSQRDMAWSFAVVGWRDVCLT